MHYVGEAGALNQYESQHDQYWECSSYSDHSVSPTPSDIFQCDGANSLNSTATSHNSSSQCESEGEVDNAPEPVVLVPAAVQPGPGRGSDQLGPPGGGQGRHPHHAGPGGAQEGGAEQGPGAGAAL